MTSALVLAGHGSHISPLTASLIWSHVDALRAMHIADEVTAAFWKEMPSFATVLNTLTADDITLVPLFTAQGYFTQTVIPAEMQLAVALTLKNERTIRYARTLSEHPYLTQVVQQRVHDAIKALGVSPESTAVAVIGHSTRRNPESRRATEAQAEHIRELGIAQQVEAVYLDDAPEIAAIYEMTSAPNLIAVPYFLALGSHTTIDVPKALGMSQGQSLEIIKGRTVYYTPPVGIDEMIRDIILELARDAGAPLKQPSNGANWDCFPTAGWESLITTVEKAGEFCFGQLRVSPSEIHVWDDEFPVEIIDNPGTLRTRVRENPFRSLATSADLPRGWRVPVSTPQMMCAVVETIYPGAIADWSAHQNKRLVVNNFDHVIQRQTGNYRKLEFMISEQQVQVVNALCRQCVRQPTWYHGTSTAEAIPCPEPCNHWLSAALEIIE